MYEKIILYSERSMIQNYNVNIDLCFEIAYNNLFVLFGIFMGCKILQQQ